jgi:hypothetical protein
VFMSTKWDSWSDKRIVSNNILPPPPPPPLQSSKISNNGEMHFHAKSMCLFISNI